MVGGEPAPRLPLGWLKISVVGAGAIGLSTAVAPRERGHRVAIQSAAAPADTVSAVAGATWFPYQVDPPERASSMRAYPAGAGHESASRGYTDSSSATMWSG